MEEINRFNEPPKRKPNNNFPYSFGKKVKRKESNKEKYYWFLMVLPLVFNFIHIIMIPMFYTSFYSAIISFLNLISYFILGIGLMQIRKCILEPYKYIKKKNSERILVFGSLIILINLLFLIDGIYRSIPESRLFYILYFLVLTLPLLFNGIIFIFYGFNVFKRTNCSFVNLKNVYIQIREKIWKIKKTTLSKLIKVDTFLIIFLSLSMLGNTTILKNFYYNISYDVETENPDILIEKVETLDYLSLLQSYDRDGSVHILTTYYLDGCRVSSYINREYLEYQKKEISEDSKRFHWWVGYRHYFNYTLKATMEPKLNFIYANNTIIKAQYGTLENIFIVKQDRDTGLRYGNWYINFTQVPYVANKTSISLNNTILVEMVLWHEYFFSGLGAYLIFFNQFIVLNENLQVIFIYVPHFGIGIA